MYVFTGAYFLQLGMPLHFILLFYGLEFGLRGFICPLGTKILHRLGLIKGLSLSVISRILFFIGLSLAEDNLYLGFGSLVFASLAGGIYNPFVAIVEAIYIKEDHNRGKQISLGIIMQSLGAIIGSAGVGFIMVHIGFFAVVILVAICQISSLFCLAPLKKQEMPKSISQKDVYKFLFSKDLKVLRRICFGEQFIIIFSYVVVPLFIYNVVGSLDHLGYLIAISILLEKLFTLYAGHSVDKYSPIRSMSFATKSYLLVLSAYVFLPKSALSILFAETSNKIVRNLQRSSIRATIHRYVRQHYPNKILSFGAIWEMAFCFCELVALPLLALAAYFIGINVFYVSCALAAFGILIINKNLKLLSEQNAQE